MNASVNKQVLIAAIPVGAVKHSDFKFVDTDIPRPDQGEILVKVHYLSMDPAMKGWMENRGGYMAPLAIGDVMRAFGVGEIVESQSDRFKAGEFICGLLGWQQYSLMDGADASLYTVDPSYPLSAYLGVLGVTGFTAYFGLLDIGKPKEGEVVVISGAGGAVGTTAGQIAKLKGCRVIGIAGSDEKNLWLKESLGFDEVINYKTENVADKLDEYCPNGMDIYFDNVGGDVLDLALDRLRKFARVVLCGGISRYNKTGQIPGPENYFNLIFRSALMQGYIVGDYQARYPEALDNLKAWLESGKLQYAEDIQPGIENLPDTMMRLFDGRNKGKQLAKLV